MNKVMEIIKKNLLSIICGAVALLAIVAVFWPITGMFQDLQTRADARKGVHGALDGLLKKNRQLPALDPVSTEQKPLEQFPTESLIAKGEAIKAQIEKEATNLVTEAVKINQAGHAVLEPDALPGGTNSSRAPAGRFREKYKSYMDYMNPRPEIREQSMPAVLMQAGIRPTEPEIQAAREALKQEIMTNDLARDNNGRELNRPQVEQKIASELPKVGDAMRYETASKIKVYIDQGTMDINPRILLNPAQQPFPTDIFWTQMGLWVQEDIARSVAEANKDAKTVMESTVKRILKIDVPEEFARATSTVQPNPEGGMEMPQVSADPSAAITPNFAVSPTGRSSNGLYDVMHFKIDLIVDAQKVPAVLQAFSKNKFMSIYQAEIRAVDSAAEQAAGYYYGASPVVLMNLEGEALFMRQWTTPLIPQRLKNELGINPPVPQQ